MHIHSHLFPKAAYCFIHARRTIYRSASCRGAVLKGLTMSLRFILKNNMVEKRSQEGLFGSLCQNGFLENTGSAGQQSATNKRAWGRVRAEVRLPPQPAGSADTALSHAGLQGHQDFRAVFRRAPCSSPAPLECRPQGFLSINSFCSCFFASLPFSLC